MADKSMNDLVANSVDDTAAEPGPDTRTVMDVDGDAFSIRDGQLIFANPDSMRGDPKLYRVVTRIPWLYGRYILCD